MFYVDIISAQFTSDSKHPCLEQPLIENGLVSKWILIIMQIELVN